ncbi:MAG: PspC domain-containing protein [Gammaproteobacteria bacterium]|nr:PspC domain-containing protein [Gammaproteobacteria bacterium]
MRTSDRYDTSPRRRLGLDAKEGIIGGVCAGIARVIDVDVSWVRVATVITAIFFTKIMIAAYLVAWLVLDRHS